MEKKSKKAKPAIVRVVGSDGNDKGFSMGFAATPYGYSVYADIDSDSPKKMGMYTSVLDAVGDIYRETATSCGKDSRLTLAAAAALYEIKELTNQIADMKDKFTIRLWDA